MEMEMEGETYVIMPESVDDKDVDGEIQISINPDYDDGSEDGSPETSVSDRSNCSRSCQTRDRFPVLFEQLLRCEKCDRKFISPECLAKHVITHQYKRSYVCRHCHHETDSELDLQNHLKTHNGEMPFMCDVCGKGFANVYHYRSHYRTHTGEKPYKCGICGKRFTTSTGLRYHERTRTGKNCSVRVNSKPCEVTPNLSVEETKRTVYVVPPQKYSPLVKSPVEDSFGDNEVSKSTTDDKNGTRISFDTDPAMMTPVQKFNLALSFKEGSECMICGKKFHYSYVLKCHLRVHSDEEIDHTLQLLYQSSDDESLHDLSPWKPYACKECGHECCTSSDLKEHMLSHSAEKPHFCKYCGKCFGKSHNLYAHVRTHTGEKPFKCVDCGKRFTTSTGFRYHNKVHHAGSASHFSEEKIKDVADPGFLKIVSVTSLADSSSTDIHPSMFAGIDEINTEVEHSDEQSTNHLEAMILSADDISEVDKQADNIPIVNLECEVCGAEFVEEAILERHMKKHKAIKRKKAQAAISQSNQDKPSPEEQIDDCTMNDHSQPEDYIVNEGDAEHCQLPILLEGSVHSIADDAGFFQGEQPDGHYSPPALQIVEGSVQSVPQDCQFDEDPELIADSVTAAETTSPTSQAEFSCPACNKVVRSLAKLEAHFKTHSRTYYCPYCTQTFTTISSLNHHTVQIHPNADTVPIKLDSDPNVDTNLRSKIQDEVLKVTSDNDSSENDDKELDEQPSIGDSIPKVTYLYDSAPVDVDISTVETDKNNDICKCSVCGIIVGNRQDLITHMHVHELKATHNCLICGKECGTQHLLAVHLRIHTGNKPYRCDVCTKRFRKKNHYMNHKRTHLGLRPFQCHICQKRFTASNGLKYHLTHVHKPGKPVYKYYESELDDQGIIVVKRKEEVNSGMDDQITAVHADADDVSLMQMQAHQDVKESDTSALCAEITERMNKALNPHALPLPKPSRVDNTVSSVSISEQLPPNSTVDAISTCNNVIANVVTETGSNDSANVINNPSFVNEIESKEPVCNMPKDSAMSPRRKSKRKSSTPSYYGIKVKKDVSKLATYLGEASQSLDDMVPIEDMDLLQELDSFESTEGVYPERYAESVSSIVEGGKDEMPSPPNDDSQVMNEAEDSCAGSSSPNLIDVADEISLEQVLKNSAEFIFDADINIQEAGADILGMFEPCVICHCNIPGSEYEFHMKQHDERRFKCTICNFKFSNLELLKKHEKLHPKETPFECIECGLGLMYAADLQNHRRVHKSKKKYECLYCGKFFGKSDNLKSHVRTHTGEKPYICDICDKRFTTSTGLKYHERHRTEENCHKGIKIATRRSHYQQAYDIITEAAKMGKTREDIALMSGKPKLAGNTYQLDSTQVLVFPKTPVVNLSKKIAMKETLKELESTTVLPAEVEHIFNAPDVNSSSDSQHSYTQKDYDIETQILKDDLKEGSTYEFSKVIKTKSTKCHFCLKVLSDMSGLRKHLRIHTGEKPYKCKVCDMRFARCDYLSKHKIQHKLQKLQQCNMCNECFSAADLKTHKAVIHSVWDATPIKCPQSPQEESSLESSTPEFTENTDLQCPTCSRTFSNDRLFHIHCGICTGDDMIDNQGEEPDITVTFDGFEITCSPPGSDVEDLDDQQDVEKHEEKEEDEEESSSEEGDVSEEEWVAKPQRKAKKKHYCTSCAKEFTAFSDMIQHLQSHSGTKSFPCPHPKCMFTFRSLQALEEHELEHNGSAPIKPQNACNLCGKTFKTFELLKSHFPDHLGGKTYRCSMCRQSYKQFRELHKHVKVCGEKEFEFLRPYACNFCDKQFKKQDHIKTHIRTHTGEKPYECQVCQKTFAASTGLRLHQKRGPPYLCATEQLKKDLAKPVFVRKNILTISSSSKVKSPSKKTSHVGSSKLSRSRARPRSDSGFRDSARSRLRSRSRSEK